MIRLLILFFCTCLIACTEISYKEPQPRGIKALTKIPTKLQGKYLMDKDTVVLFENGFRGKDRETGKEEVLNFPSDTIVLKEYKGNYFVSYRDGDFWLLRIMSVKKNGDIYFLVMDPVPDVGHKEVGADTVLRDTLSKVNVMIDVKDEVVDDSKRREFINKLSKETPVMEIDSHFIIDPSPQKLNKLLKKGFFKNEDGKSYLKRIN